MSYAYNSEEFDFNLEGDFIHDFENGEIINELEMIVMEIVEMILGDCFRYCPQVPLRVICSHSVGWLMILGDCFRYCPQVPLGVICSHSVGWLPNEIWKFWVNSRVDIALMERGFKASRKAKLAIECQSYYHDSLEAQVRDRKKAKLLEKVGVPLIYVRSVETDRRFYRFYTPDENTEVFYNIINQEGRTELETFLTAILTL